MENNLWNLSLDELYKKLNSSLEGLKSNQYQKKLKIYGKNEIVKENRFQTLKILINQFKSPLILILIFATFISFTIGDITESIIIFSILFINSILGFFQEYKAQKIFRLLKKYTTSKSKVLRDGNIQEIDSRLLVPGDIVFLNSGDIVPADTRIINSKNFSLDESTLTGESIPVIKEPSAEVKETKLTPENAKYIVFMGTSVISGQCKGIVFATGEKTYFGQLTKYIQKEESITDFQKNIKKFGLLLMKITLIMTVFIFIINTFQHKVFFDSLLFALAIAVGITPELLPIIITITLSQGAMYMSKRKVIVKKLTSIENLGNMDTLCCDKTGTLTEGIFSVTEYKTFDDKENDTVLIYGLICGQINFHNNKPIFGNPLDKSIWEKAKEKNKLEDIKNFQILDRNEFNFEKRRISCIAKFNNEKILIYKGSPDALIPLCNSIVLNEKLEKLTDQKIQEINNKINQYEEQGYRIILITYKDTQEDTIKNIQEKDLILLGYLIFIDPPKQTAKESLKKIKKLGVDIKIITGDSPIITKKICNDLGLKIVEDKIITGQDIENIKDENAYEFFLKYNVYARITPDQKYRIIKVLNYNTHIVGFLGDGINDAPALKAADVGISVDSAVDIAKDASDIVLLKKSLKILTEGIIEGRKAFGNTTKYIFNTISANFGNMITVSISSFLLPFIPLLPAQILLVNLISDIPLLTISTDNVDEEFLIKPRKWNLELIKKFMIYFGLISSFYDLFLIIPLKYIFNVKVEIFRTSWFILSCLTEILVTFFIRTRKPFFKSMPSKYLLYSSILMTLITLILPFTPIGLKFFDLRPLSLKILIFISIVLTLYCLTVEKFKVYFFRKF